MDLYPLVFRPLYKEKIWGGRNLDRLFGRDLPSGQFIGESWELADLPQGVSVVANGPLAGQGLTGLTRNLGPEMLGQAAPIADGRFPLLLKYLDANDILSLQVHPDRQAVAEIPGAALKTECWYVVESRSGFIYKGVKPGVTPEQFRRAVAAGAAADVVQRFDVAAGDFHYLPAGTVHALGAGVVVAEVQTPSDTTYRVTDWGRGREIHVERSMQCIRFEPPCEPPGAAGPTLLCTEFFRVDRLSIRGGSAWPLSDRCCRAVMMLSGRATIGHEGGVEPTLRAYAGDTILIPASLRGASLEPIEPSTFLDIILPPKQVTTIPGNRAVVSITRLGQ